MKTFLALILGVLIIGLHVAGFYLAFTGYKGENLFDFLLGLFILANIKISMKGE